MSHDLENLVLGVIERWVGGRYNERHGVVTSYDPKKYLAKVTFQPEGQESGWLPIETGHIGQGYGIVIGLQPGQGGVDQQGQGGQAGQPSSNQGDQVVVRFQEGDFEGGKIVQRVHSDQDKPPEAKPGEIIIWTKFQKSGGPKPDAGDGGQGGDGQKIKLLSDGSLSVEDGNGAKITLDGKGNIQGNVEQPGEHITHQIVQGQGQPPGGGGLGDIGSMLGGLSGQLSALSGAGVGLPGIQNIGKQLSGLTSAITGAGGSADSASLISGIGSQLSSITSMGGVAGLASQLSGALSSLMGMIGGMSQSLHMTVLDQAKGIVASAFQGQHKTTWDQSGVTHSSSTAVTSTAPQLPHNGLGLFSDALQVTKGVFGQSFNLLSDRRLKTKVRTHRPVLADVLKLRLKTFRVKSLNWQTGEVVDGDRQSLGFIAQQLQKTFPELVHRSGKYLVVEEEKIGPILVGALQEFVADTRAEMDSLRLEIDSLRYELDRRTKP